MGMCARLWPLLTSGDGNCLLHAASLAMLGRHDRSLALRRALHARMLRDAAPLYRRWRWQSATEYRTTTGLQLSETEWHAEWQSLVRLSAPTPKTVSPSAERCDNDDGGVGDVDKKAADMRSPHDTVQLDAGGGNMLSENLQQANGHVLFESLEEIHVFALANELRRPIIVVADVVMKDVHGEALAPIPFGGVYLPLLERPECCCRDPLLLTFDAAHFSALVSMTMMEGGLARVIPLVTPNFELLPLHFVEDPGPNWRWDRDGSDAKLERRVTLSDEHRRRLLEQYLRVQRLPLSAKLLGAAEEPLQSSGSSMSLNATTDSLSESSSSRTSTLDRGSRKGGGGGATERARRDRKSKQLQVVADKVGSIGKSLSRSFRRAFRTETSKKRALSVLNNNISETDGGGGGGGGGGGSGGGNATGLTAACLAEHEALLVAQLGCTSPHYVTEMVSRYMDAAEKRFRVHDVLHKRHSAAEECLSPCADNGKSDAAGAMLAAHGTMCCSLSCSNFCDAELDGLCSGCHLGRSCASISTAVAAATPRDAGPEKRIAQNDDDYDGDDDGDDDEEDDDGDEDEDEDDDNNDEDAGGGALATVLGDDITAEPELRHRPSRFVASASPAARPVACNASSLPTTQLKEATRGEHAASTNCSWLSNLDRSSEQQQSVGDGGRCSPAARRSTCRNSNCDELALPEFDLLCNYCFARKQRTLLHATRF